MLKRIVFLLKVRAFFADKIPQSRNFNIEYTLTLITPSSFSSQLQGQDLPEAGFEYCIELPLYFDQERNLHSISILEFLITLLKDRGQNKFKIPSDFTISPYSELPPSRD